LLANELDDDNLAAISSLQGWLALWNGDSTVAVIKYQQSLDLWKRRHRESHASTGWGYILLDNAKANAGHFVSALADMQRGLSILDGTLGSQSRRYLMAEIAYSHALDQTDAYVEAARMKTTAEQELKEFYRVQCADCTVSATAFH